MGKEDEESISGINWDTAMGAVAFVGTSSDAREYRGGMMSSCEKYMYRTDSNGRDASSFVS
eukprot:CAMPEP_0194056356 /NCGR_PEP_ID=MMETSP0009_2-20130614/59865_1 /TAXON_ID=210454 /ORGANISM="Grammatophora oceanica, Strain CCMP 410" /LENGTH=60 /DNA_ID=CAMNT_0038705681 /DNA_START=360 /DNA_END=542 /DNA_ORIENTATION=-